MKLRVRGIALCIAAVSAFAAPALHARVPAPRAEIPSFALSDGAPRCDGVQGYSADFGGRRTFLWRPQWIASISDAAKSDPQVEAQIIEAGEKALSRGPYSVTDKPQPVPGATANDYASIGPYWWPDPAKPGGLPYIRRDGEVNPERDGPEFDKSRLRDLENDVEALAIAYTISGDIRFANHAASLIRTWFLDPVTRMNPNLDFAQGIPGRVNGRGFGIIDSSSLSTIVESAGLLRPSGALNQGERAALRAWYGDLVVWLVTSDNGIDEMQTTNNHGVFYDFYVAHFALFAGVPSAATKMVDSFPDYRLGVQMDRQGRFIKELERTRSWHYANFIVIGAAKLATIGECVDRDLWGARLPDGRGMHSAEAFLARYAENLEDWPFKDRDLSAGNIGKMRATAQRTKLLLDRSSGRPAWDELP